MRRTWTYKSVAVVVCLAAAASFWLLGLWPSEGQAPRERFNLVLVSVDTLRADSLSSYGSRTVRTPNMDRLADEGVLFEQVVTTAPTTLPAHASLLTGVTPLRHLVHDNVGFSLPEDVPTLASLLRQEGYRTGGFVGAFVLDSRFGIGRGFDVYYDRFVDTAGGFARERRGGVVLEQALDWLEEARAEPFFAFLHFYDPHRPYDPPEPFLPQQVSNRALYEGEVAYVDSLIGRLLDWLDERGLSDETIVVLTADHGESLGEHGEETHMFFLYESVLRIPLLVRYPGADPGRRVREMVRIIDVAPTCLDLLGVSASEEIEGRSLRPLLEGADGTFDVAAYSETFVPRLHYGWSELRSLRRGNHKFILAPRSELYDLDADPGETQNLTAARPNVARRMKKELEGILLEVRGSVPEPAGLDARTLSTLQSLGYLGGTGESDGGRSFTELTDPKDGLELYKKISELSGASDIAPEERARRFRAILKEDPSNLRAHTLYGELLLQANRPEEAATIYENLVELQPDSATGVYGLARAQMALGQTAEAKKNLERAIEIDPDSADGYSGLAELARNAGELTAAETWLRKALAVSPDRFLYEELIEVLLALGRGDEAEVVLGDDASAAYVQGQRLFDRGDTEGALQHLRRASRLAPEDDDVQQALGNAFAASGDFEEAMTSYLAIVKRSLCSPGAHLNLGAVYERLGRLDEALAAYQKAVACDADYDQAYRNLASLLARRGDVRRAIDALKSALRLRPDDAELSQALEQLEAYKNRRR